GLQVSQDIEDSHVTLTPVHSDGQQESSSTSSFVTSLLNLIIDPGMKSIFTTGSSSVTPIPLPKSTMTPSIITTTITASQPPIPPTPIPSDILQTLPNFASVFRFEDRVKSLEVNFSKFMRTNQSPEAVSNIPDRLQDSFQRENDDFLRTIDDNMKKIIKERVKNQVKAQVTRILPRIEESLNAQLEAEVLTRSSHSSRTLYAVAADLLEMELKKILIDKMEGNKSIQRSDEQRNLYKALVDAYEADKTILDSYGESAILKRRREEHASASTPSEPATTSVGRSTTGTQSRQMSASESAFAKEPVQTTCQMEEPSHPVFETGAEDQPIVQTSQHPEWFSQPRKPPTSDRDWNKTLPAVQGNAQSWISVLVKQTDARSSFNELFDTPIDFSNIIMNRLGVDTLTPELLAGPTYELMRGSYYRHIKWIEDLVPRTMWIQEPLNYDKHALWGVSHWGRKRQQFYGFAVNRESALNGSNATDVPPSSSLISDRLSRTLSGKSKKSSHQPKAEDTNQENLSLLHMDLCGPMRVESINEKKTDNGTKFVNQTLRGFYENVSISHQTSVARTPQHNSIVERRNQTLMKAARIMLIFSKAPLFLWAEAINTACYTQNCSLIRIRYSKTPYELMHEKKPDLSFFHVFGSLCYPTNDSEDLGKLNAKVDIAMASKQFGLRPGLQVMTLETSSSRLVPNIIPQQPCNPLNRDDWDSLFQPLFDEYFNPLTIAVSSVPVAAAPRAIEIVNLHVSTSIDQDASSSSIPSTQEQEHSSIISQNINESPKTPLFYDDPLYEFIYEDSNSQGSSSNMRPSHTQFEIIGLWTKDYPIENVIGDPSRSVSTIKQLKTDAMWCYFDAFLTFGEPKNFK
nr:hypothetical protein [Tanacetum cinerariifolium]